MSKSARLFLLVILTTFGTAYTSSSIAQPSQTKSQVVVRTTIDGKFAHNLESPNGDVDGIVLEDGTIASFDHLNRAHQVMLFRPGDSVQVTGDVVSGLAGPYLVHALATGLGVPTATGAIPPQAPSEPTAPGNGSHRTAKHGAVRSRGSRESSIQPRSTTTKTKTQSRSRGRLETIGAKVRAATSGKGNGGDNAQWSRPQETAGP
jgi:hypothetical protein